MEFWKDINGYEGYYQISSYGNVKNVTTGTILIGDTNNVGYRRVTLHKPIKKRFFVHKLVAMHFCDGFKENLVVNHKDGDKLNNHSENLEWVTRSENDLHAYRLNLRHPNPCKFKKSILSYDKNTGEFVKEYKNSAECCKELKVAKTNIYNCCNGKQGSCRGFILRYKE